MTRDQEAVAIAVRALSPKQKANLRWHLKHKTKILCGPKAEFYFSPTGYG